MKMLKVKYNKNTYQFRLDWLVVWSLIHTHKNKKNPEKWEFIGIFAEPGYYKPNQISNNVRPHREVSFEFDTEAEAMAAVSIVDI